MKIGSVDLGHKQILAPLAEVSDSAFRKISKEFGAGLTFTQMVSAKGIATNNFNTLRLLAYPKSEKPIGIQILGNDEKYLYSAVKEIKQYKPDLIDLNCGCPVNKVTKYKMGAAILENPSNLGLLIKSMVKAAEDTPISAKLRLGVSSGKINILETAKAAEDNGASLLFVHTRTKADRYYDDAQWEWLAKVKSVVSIPVVGNGSIFTPKDIDKMLRQTGVDSVLVARGALGNPFIFNRYNRLVETGTDPGEPDLSEIKAVALKHLNLLAQEFGESIGVNKAKKHIIWYFKFLNGIEYLLGSIFTLRTLNEITELINTHTEKIENGEYEDEIPGKIFDRFKERVQFWLDDN
ncbi:MAG: tRNA dihydrouridine synthase DusB [Bacteroidota bacterium]